LLWRMWMSMKRVARDAHSFFRGRRHRGGIIVANRALRTGDQP
jgi:hypothetical protein